MKINFSDITWLMIDQVVKLAPSKPRAFAKQICASIAMHARSSKTNIEDVTFKTVDPPFARYLLGGVGTSPRCRHSEQALPRKTRRSDKQRILHDHQNQDGRFEVPTLSAIDESPAPNFCENQH